MSAIHEQLAAGNWQKLSLAEQLGNVGSEISRARRWQNKNDKLFNGAIDRAFELLDLTIQDSRHRSGLRELARAREVLGDAILGGQEYGTSLDNLLKYFDQFALGARQEK